MWPVIIAGLSFGFVSSFHCIGMCGPLVLALPVQTLPVYKRTAAILLYHTGRLATYVLLGVLFGLAGAHLFIAGFQRQVSIMAGAIILGIILCNAVSAKMARTSLFGFPVIQKYMRRLWAKASLTNFSLLGALNGLLPCGMVYFALITSLGFGAFNKSLVFMLGFGCGTLVLMLALHYFGSAYIGVAFRNKIRKAIPVMLAFAGVLLIFRGLNLGIPFISPLTAKAASPVIPCH